MTTNQTDDHPDDGDPSTIDFMAMVLDQCDTPAAADPSLLPVTRPLGRYFSTTTSRRV
jgi:hypothetical protein